MSFQAARLLLQLWPRTREVCSRVPSISAFRPTAMGVAPGSVAAAVSESRAVPQ